MGRLHLWPQNANLRRYSFKYKNLLVVKQFDYRELIDLNKKQQYEILKTKVLEAITDIDKMKRKPKDFDRSRFYIEMKNILEDYETKYID